MGIFRCDNGLIALLVMVIDMFSILINITVITVPLGILCVLGGFIVDDEDESGIGPFERLGWCLLSIGLIAFLLGWWAAAN